MIRVLVFAAFVAVAAAIFAAPIANADAPYPNCKAAAADGRYDIPSDDPAYGRGWIATRTASAASPDTDSRGFAPPWPTLRSHGGANCPERDCLAPLQAGPHRVCGER